MAAPPSRVPYTIAIVAGLVLWGTTAAVADRTEPWDSPGFWSFVYPLAIALAGVLGYAFPHRPWRWAVALVFSQAAIMILNGSGFGLLPLGLVMLGVLSLPAVALASIGARIRTRSARASN